MGELFERTFTEQRLLDAWREIGWRDAPQMAWSRAPPKRIRRKAPPDIEGIETGDTVLEWPQDRRVAMPRPISRA
jgi:hypothetical protein